MEISVNSNDIFRFAVGNTIVHPIESHIDFKNRYEVFSAGIYDLHSKCFLPQSELYKSLYSAIEDLKAESKTLNSSEINAQCLAIADIKVEIDLN
jgi:hypothetical protein